MPSPEYNGKGYTRKRTFHNGFNTPGKPLLGLLYWKTDEKMPEHELRHPFYPD